MCDGARVHASAQADSGFFLVRESTHANIARPLERLYCAIVFKIASHSLSSLLIPLFYAAWRISVRDFETPDTLRALFIRFPISIGAFRPLTHLAVARPCDGRARFATAANTRVKRNVQLVDCCDINSYAVAVVFSLFPHDFHHVFSPVDGRIEKIVYIEGRLRFNPARRICENRRVCVEISTASDGKLVLVLVGAIGVGTVIVKVRAGSRVAKGQHIGYFDVGGSAVVLGLQTRPNARCVIDGSSRARAALFV